MNQLERFESLNANSSSSPLNIINNNIEKMSSTIGDSKTKATTIPSEKIISHTIQNGIQNVVVETCTGLVIGGLMGIVLAKGGGSSAARKSITGLSGGIGFGHAWTKTNMNLERLILTATPPPPSSPATVSAPTSTSPTANP